MLLAKPEWGTKRICQSCGVRFYDFGRSPIVCPACGGVFDLEILNRARRARPSSRAVAAAAEGAPAVDGDLIGSDSDTDDDIEVEVEEDDAVVVTDDDAEEDESLIEDASELGDDEELSDVIESDIDEEAR